MTGLSLIVGSNEMDENKRQTMHEIGYEIKRVCGLCEFARIQNPESMWGTCARVHYFHGKHRETRDLSICVFGTCPGFYESDTVALSVVGKYREFLEEEKRC